MDVVKFGEKTNEKTVMALGYFDAVHCGHKALLNRAITLSKELEAKPSCMMFCGNYKKDGEVFTFEERLIRMQREKMNFIVYANLDGNFMSKTPNEFINGIFSNFDVKGLICGEDFTFGKNAEGNVEYLKNVCEKNGVLLSVVKKVTDGNGNKISTSDIKRAVSCGDIKRVNLLLGDDYFVKGKVIKGKTIGRTIGFPTANLVLPKEKTPIKQGVYKTYVILNEKKYPSITNVGNQPTVGGKENIIETHIKGFSGDLYDKNITVYFTDFLREIVKFKNIEDLKKQLEKDMEKLNND